LEGGDDFEHVRDRAAGRAGVTVRKQVHDTNPMTLPNARGKPLLRCSATGGEQVQHFSDIRFSTRPLARWTMTLQLLFDAFAMAGPFGRSGIGTYERRLLAGLSTRDDVTVYALAVDEVELPPGIHRHRMHRRAPGRFAQREHDVRLSFDMRRAPGDVFHSPSPFAPQRPVRRPWVQTLHDVIPLVFDDPGLAEAKRRLTAAAPAYRRAHAVIAVSRHAADEGIRVLGLDPSRVHVVHECVGPEFTPGPSAPPAEEPYLLLVSAYDPRKGFEEAFAVIGALAEAEFPHVLKVVGDLPPWVRPVVEDLRRRAPRPDRIQLLGYVDDIVPLFHGATATLVTSRYEGFGLPALEAMASGSPVVAFANSSLPEVIGNGGVLVPDGNVPQFAEAVSRVLVDDSHRDGLIAAGIARAAGFTEAEMVRGHMDVYLSLAR
jgi:alpha-1,3-rhamnosyl/mannosyltransferase